MKKDKSITLIIMLISILPLYSSQSLAKDSARDTDIVCFASPKKWICAPKDKQELAQEKAKKLINTSKSSESRQSDVVVRSLSLPKMQALDYSDPDSSTNEQNIASQAIVQRTTPSKPVNVSTAQQSKPPASRNINEYADYWSYQLIGVSSKQAAIKFVSQNQLNKNDILIVESEYKDSDWFVVLYNLYKDKKTALQDQINLPNNVEEPWLRPLHNLVIKNLIENF